MFLLLWLILPGLALSVLGSLNRPYYFTTVHPAGFLLMARQAELLNRAWRARWWARRFRFLLLACFAFSVVLLYCLAGDLVDSEGFEDGEYGMSYRYMLAHPEERDPNVALPWLPPASQP